MRVIFDEARARAVADLMVESFEPAEAASTAFETEDAWPGGGKAWAVEVYFGFEPDEEGFANSSPPRPATEAAARGIRPDRKAGLGRQCACGP